MYVNEPANFDSGFYIAAFKWFILSLSILCVSFFLPWCSGLINAAERADFNTLCTFTSGH